jgi:coenzyme Q-binding protein COQ10
MPLAAFNEGGNVAFLRHALLVDAPVETVDRVVGDPLRWPSFWAGMTHMKHISGNGDPGTTIEVIQKVMWMRLPLTVVTTEKCHNPDGSSDWRWRYEGAACGWLAFHHQPVGSQTKIVAEKEYASADTAFGRAVDRLLVDRSQKRHLAACVENIKTMAEAAAVP